jgi:DNA-binding response OmpR family regulator
MKTALIVEDDADQAEIAARLLRKRKYQTTIVCSGEEGLEQARQIVPDLLLLDLMLPDLDGFEVCRRIRAESRTRLVPLVMVTALADETNRRRGLRIGANAYVAKPYGADELLRAISAAEAWRRGLARTRVRGEIVIDFSSEPILLQEVNEFLTSLCRETPLAVEQIGQVRQALLEMGQNAIEWGNRHRAEEVVRITYRVCADRLEIVIQDQGPGFDPNDLPHAASPDDPLRHMDVREKLGLREGGFGLMISRGLLDELRHNERGNEVTLVKRFPINEGSSVARPAPAKGPARA